MGFVTDLLDIWLLGGKYFTCAEMKVQFYHLNTASEFVQDIFYISELLDYYDVEMEYNKSIFCNVQVLTDWNSALPIAVILDIMFPVVTGEQCKNIKTLLFTNHNNKS